MLERIKLNLRISHHKLDQEITDTIEACKDDLERVGVNFDETDELVFQAVKLYVRFSFNFENQATRYLQAYEGLRNAMSMNGRRRQVDV